MKLENLEAQVTTGDPGTRTLEDQFLPAGTSARARIRTLVYDRKVHQRDIWLARCLPSALGPEAQVARMFLGRQCHGTTIRDADRDPALPAEGRCEFEACDGLITREPGVVLAVRTADCVPIVVSCAAQPWIGAVHAGWRGTLAGILGHLLDRAVADGCRARDLHLWVGPHIRACHYQVSPQLCDQFVQGYPERQAMVQGRHLSLLEANIAQAARAGVPTDQITASPLCTFEGQNALPSYRRDGQCRGEIITTVILLPRDNPLDQTLPET